MIGETQNIREQHVIYSCTYQYSIYISDGMTLNENVLEKHFYLLTIKSRV